MPKCTACGANLPEQVTSCPACGTAVAVEPGLPTGAPGAEDALGAVEAAPPPQPAELSSSPEPLAAGSGHR